MNKQTEALKLALEALEQTLQTLDDENAKPGGAIADTIWRSEHETLFDYLGSKITAFKEALAQPEQGPENPTDADRLDWLQKAADARKVELARSIYKTGYEIGEWPSMRVTVKYGSLRQTIDAAMMKAGNT